LQPTKRLPLTSLLLDTWAVKQRAYFLSIDECGGVRGTAVVIDVLRAFTTAAWAFHLGAERIILSDSVQQALDLKAFFPGALAMKDAEPLEGFELSNSPVELQAAGSLTGRVLVQKTTAGTVGAVAVRHARRLYCASFVCASATAARIRDEAEADVCFVVTGEGGAAEEDRACAEYIATLLENPRAPAEPYLERAAGSRAAASIRRRIEARVPGVDPGDIDACLQVNRFDFAMRASDEDGLLVLRRL
jgi:2-phosphosulfolactate phosphatase